ncbi:choline/ethanolamine kinase family protein [Microbulbifer taiwanensis]|uniref:Phosphotransferase n=1 Tax=Microbulbifer taiwanensis TaxID=986746 RepID=A0ABW1YLV6_9GAMM|nr:choline/ethanolamine kinase family protein [Microbulbifer taiwanensis]
MSAAPPDPAPADIVPPDWQRWSATKPSVLRPLTGGLTNKSYLLVADGERLVIRRNSAISASLDLNRTAEHEALLRADRGGLCAPLVYCDPDHRYLVTRYIEGGSWHSERPGALRQLAQLLRNIHTLPAIDTQLDIEAKAASYWRSIDRSTALYPALHALRQEIPQHIAAAGALGDGHCLCHNDLLKANLIVADDGNLYAIDWEYAAMGDPFYDLAVIVEEYGLNEGQQNLLLTEYLGLPVTPGHWKRLDHCRVIYGYLAVLWYAVQWCSGAMTEPRIGAEISQRIRDLSTLSSATV